MCVCVYDSTDEAERAKASVGTAALLEYLHEREQTNSRHENSTVEYTFCLGADAFMDLTDGKWRESERVLELLQGRLLVLNRIEQEAQASAAVDNDNNSDKQQQPQSQPDQKSTATAAASAIPEALQTRVNSISAAKLVSVPSLGAVSSSRVREAVAAQEWDMLEQNTSLVHPAVLAYIRRHGLYAATTDKK